MKYVGRKHILAVGYDLFNFNIQVLISNFNLKSSIGDYARPCFLSEEAHLLSLTLVSTEDYSSPDPI